ncbi:MAG: hypothetical protein V4440_03020, partial [Pseudomonadota bacterium]
MPTHNERLELSKKIKSFDSADDKLALYFHAYRKRCFNDFFYFAKDFLGYKDLEREVHGQFIKVFESKAPRKIVVMPRGSFKSTLGSVAYPIWRL